MINNRQGGRRRGRGGQGSGGSRNLGGQPGNRQDNRQRGNAAQLLEKYKSMARDSQLAGDRVQTEYYLQYADHYFRVLSESRARFEEQNPRRHRDDEDEDEGDEELVEGGEEMVEERAERPERQERAPRQDRGERFNRERRPRRDDRDERGGREANDRDDRDQVNGAGETIPFDVLPPAIGRDDSDDEVVAEEKPRRPRRARAPRPAEGDDEIAPAA
ncbi:MAG: DUF4167 domain-containing protein [Sphingomicrobium sp.]